MKPGTLITVAGRYAVHHFYTDLVGERAVVLEALRNSHGDFLHVRSLVERDTWYIHPEDAHPLASTNENVVHLLNT